MMMNDMDLLSRIEANRTSMSKGQRALSSYIKQNYDKAASLTAARLGEAVHVSESTVVRYAISLGYKGYPEFQRALDEFVRSRLNSIQRMEAAKGRMGKSNVLKYVLQSDADMIKHTADMIDPDAFDEAVRTILHAKNIYIIGIRSCAPLASFLSYYMNLIFDNVHQLITSSSSELFEQMVRIGEQDVIIGISFPRYSKRTQKALGFANQRGATVITITDSMHSPINQFASCVLTAESDMAAIVDSLAAPLSVINALVAALCMEKQQQVAQTLTELERIWEDYQVYDDQEIEDLKDNKKIRISGM